MSADDVALDDVVVVGRVGSPYGVKGWVNMQSFTNPPDNILDYQPWLLKAKGGRWRRVEDVRCRRHKKGFIALIEATADRDAAAAMTGQLVGIPAQALPEPADADEYYWRELAGCEVMNESGAKLGRVDHLMETGANDVLVVRSEEGEQLLIPFAAEYVLAVDRESRTITVDWDSEW